MIDLNSKKNKLSILFAVIFFITIRFTALMYVYNERDTVIEPDDSLAYILKARVLFEDPFYKTNCLSTLKSNIEEGGQGKLNNLLNLRVLERYHISWSFIVASINKLFGVSYDDVWWMLLFIGQIILLIGCYRVTSSMGFSNNFKAVSIILYALILFKIDHASTMAPREWAFITFLNLLPFALLYTNNIKFTPFNAFAVICWSVFGSLSHPRFFLLLPIILVYMCIFNYKALLKKDMSILRLILFITITPLILIVLHAVLSFYNFPFLGFSDKFSVTQNFNLINFSTFSTNLFPAAMVLIKILGYVSICYVDAVLLIMMGIVISIKKYTPLFYFFVSFFICSSGLLFLHYPGYPAQYFFMYNSVFALVFVIFETIGLYFVGNCIFRKKNSNSFVMAYLILLIAFQGSLYASKGFDIINRGNISNPSNFINTINNNFSIDNSFMFKNQIPLYAYLIEGNYNRKLYISKDSDFSINNNGDYIIGAYSLAWTPNGLVIKKGEFLCFKFFSVQNYNNYSLSFEADESEKLFFEFFIDDLIVADFSFIELPKVQELKFNRVKMRYEGKGRSYLQKFTNHFGINSLSSSSVFPVLIPYTIKYEHQNRIKNNWRTQLISNMGLLRNKKEKVRIQSKFSTRKNNHLNLQILFNDGVFFISQKQQHWSD